MTKILIIWESIPENTRIFLITPSSEEEEAMIHAAHGVIINSSQNERAAQTLWNFLQTKPVIFDTEHMQQIRLIEPCNIVFSGEML